MINRAVIVFRFCFIYTAAVSKIVYDTYSECWEPCSFCHVKILIRFQDIIQKLSVHSIYIHYIPLDYHDYGTQ